MKSMVCPVGALFLMGCIGFEPNDDAGVCKPVDMKGDLQDLPPTKPKCDAAKGLSGVNLFCIDFSSVPEQILTTPLPSQLTGWNFEKFDKNCWQILTGKLQISTANFPTYMGTCGFLMPALTSSQYQQYNSFTLAVVQTVDVNATVQGAYIYLGSDVPKQQMWYTAGTYPKIVTSLQIARAALPNGGTGTYQPLFKLSAPSTAGGTAQGWQIESIAVMGNP